MSPSSLVSGDAANPGFLSGGPDSRPPRSRLDAQRAAIRSSAARMPRQGAVHAGLDDLWNDANDSDRQESRDRCPQMIGLRKNRLLTPMSRPSYPAAVRPSCRVDCCVGLNPPRTSRPLLVGSAARGTHYAGGQRSRQSERVCDRKRRCPTCNVLELPSGRGFSPAGGSLKA